MRESEAKIRRLVDANIIGIFIWDLDGRIIEANDAFLRMVGYDREDLAAGRMRWTELTPPEWRDSDERRLAELKLTGSLQPFEKEYFGKDGIRVPVLIGVATFEEGGNQGVAFVLDLTERKCAEQAAEHLASIVEILRRRHRQQGSRRNHQDLESRGRAPVRIQSRGGHRPADHHPDSAGSARRGAWNSRAHPPR